MTAEVVLLIAIVPSATVLVAGCVVAAYRTFTREERQVAGRGSLAVDRARQDSSIGRRLGDHPDLR